MIQTVTFKTIRDEATGPIKELIDKVNPEQLAKRCLPPLREHWRNHLAALPRNKNGWPSTGFWEGAARSVERDSYAVGGLVTLRGSGPPGKPGLAQRFYGGTIHAQNHVNVTIPICAEAYGTTVKDWGFENLTLVILADGRKFYALWLGTEAATRGWSRVAASRKGSNKSHGAEVTIRRAQQSRTAFSGKHPKVIMFKQASGARKASEQVVLKFLFILKPSVEQTGNPAVIPGDLDEVAADAITDFLKPGGKA